MQSGQTLPSKPARRELLDKMLSEGILGVLPTQSSERHFQDRCFSTFSGTVEEFPLSLWAEWIIHSCVYGGHIGEAHRIAYSGKVFQLSTCTQIHMELKPHYYRALAARDDCQDIVQKEIEQHPKDGFQMLTAAIEMGNEKIVTFLLGTRPDLAKARMPHFSVFQWAQTLRMKALLLCLTDEITDQDVEELKEHKKELLAEIKSFPPEIGNKGLMAKRREGSAVRRVVYAARGLGGLIPVRDESPMPQAFETAIRERGLENIFYVMLRWVRARKLAELEELKREQPVNFAHQLNAVVRDLAHDGETEAVSFLLEKFQANIGLAVKGYARGGRVELVNKLIRDSLRDDEDYRDFNHMLYKLAAEGFAENGWLSGSYAKILRLLALIDNKTLFIYLQQKMKEIDSHPKFWIASLGDATELRRLKTQTGISDKYRKIYKPVLKEFLQSGGDPNLGIGGFSLLHCAVVEDDEESVKLLEEYGKDKLIRNDGVLSVYDVAASTRMQALMLCLYFNLSPNDAEKLKYDKDALFEAIKELPDDIANKGLLTIYDEKSPLYQVMSAPRFGGSTASHMIGEFKKEVERRGLKPGQKVERKDRPALSLDEAQFARMISVEARAEDEKIKKNGELARKFAQQDPQAAGELKLGDLSVAERMLDAIILLAKSEESNAVNVLVMLLERLLLPHIHIYIPILPDVVYGYALGGHYIQVNSLLDQATQQPVRINVIKYWAILGYAKSGYITQLNSLVIDDEDRATAIEGFTIGGHLSGDRKSILHLLSLIEDIELRRLMAEKAKEKNNSLNVDGLMQEAAAIAAGQQTKVELEPGIDQKETSIAWEAFFRDFQREREETQALLKVARERMAALTPAPETDVPERKDEKPVSETAALETVQPTSGIQPETLALLEQPQPMSPQLIESPQITSPQLEEKTEKMDPGFLRDDGIVAKICSLAKAKDKKALEEMVQQKICLGVYDKDVNALILLAQQNEIEAVNFLLKEFHLSMNHAVYGYAIGGHVQEVNALIKGASKDWTVNGYARGGHVKEVSALLEQGASKDLAVRGYARAGHVKEVTALLDQGASKDWAVFGYASGGYVKEVNALLEQGANKDFAVNGYALNGLVKQVDALLEQGASKDYAVYGYARGGHVKEVSALLEQGASKDYAVRGYAAGGHVKEVNALIKEGASKVRAVSGYYRGGYLSGNRESVLSLMALTDGIELRRMLAEKAKEKNNSLDIDGLMKEAAAIVKYRAEFASHLSALLDKGLPLDQCMIEGIPLIECAVMVDDEDHLIDVLAKKEKVVGHYHCPREASIKLKALMLCLSRTISQEEVDYLKDYKEALFEAIKKLPKNIADNALYAARHNPDSPIHQVMYAQRGATKCDDDSHMPKEIRRELVRRGLEVEAGYTIDFNFKGTLFGESLTSTIFNKDEDSVVGFKNTTLNLSGRDKDIVTELKSLR